MAKHYRNRQFTIAQNNKQAAEEFRAAVYAAIKNGSVSTFREMSQLMVEESVKRATFSDYSGVLINSYVGFAVSKTKEEILRNAPQSNMKGGGVTSKFNLSGYREYISKNGVVEGSVYRSSDIPNITEIENARRITVNGKYRYIKRMRIPRSHTHPRTIVVETPTKFAGSIKQYTLGDSTLAGKTLHGAIEDAVVITNLAPYAKTVHRNWNRVLPGDLPEYMKRFYVASMRSTFKHGFTHKKKTK